MTINEYIAQQQVAFSRLSKSRQAALDRKARAFVHLHRTCADHSTFWRGLSARQVISAFRSI